MLTAPSYDRRKTEHCVVNSPNESRSALRRSWRLENISHERQRQEITGMADFLMNQPPPSTNLMSTMPATTERRHSNIKSSALKIFARYKLKKPHNLEPIQLPESAVSAKTLGGAKHIAISVPADKKIPNHTREKSQPRPQMDPAFKSALAAEKTQRKSLHQPRDSVYSTRSLQAQNKNKASSIKSSATSNDQSLLQSSLKRRRGLAASCSTLKTKDSYVTLPTGGKWGPNDSPRSESLHSRSSYSQLSISTTPRTLQSPVVSTSRATSPDTPSPLKSGRCYFPNSLEELVRGPGEEECPSLSIPSTPTRKESESTSVSPLIFGTGTAKLARSFSGAGVEKAHIVRCSTPNLPLGSDSTKPPNSIMTRPNSPLAVQTFFEAADEYREALQETSSGAPSKFFRNNVYNLKELATLRTTSISPRSYAPCDASRSPTPSQHVHHCTPVMSFSRVMTVANFAPEPMEYAVIAVTALDKIKENRARNPHATQDITSVTSLNSYNSDADDSDTILEYRFTGRPSIIHGNLSQNPNLDHQSCTREQPRKSYNHRERDLDTRLSKMERDNAMLLDVLNGLLKKFGEPNTPGSDSSKDERKGDAFRQFIDEKMPLNERKHEQEETSRIFFSNIKY